ncbi:1-acylglycerol-3-phosphate O-acyltransferase [Cystobasidiomycetes sp. EMM_F5]
MNQTVRYYWRFSLYCTTLGLTSAWAVALSIALNLVGKSESIQHYVARSFYYFAGPILGWTINIEGEEHLQPKTMIDILYLGRIFPKRTAVTAKRELKWSPLLGQFMWLSNSVFIDRNNRKDALGTFTRAINFMKSKRMSIWIFAEGTRTNAAEPTLKTFKKGAFHMAVQGGFPIVPVVMQNYHHLYSGRAKRFEAGELTCRELYPALPPISTEGYTSSSEDIAELSEKVRQAMIDALVEMANKYEAESQKRLT